MTKKVVKMNQFVSFGSLGYKFVTYWFFLLSKSILLVNLTS